MRSNGRRAISTQGEAEVDDKSFCPFFDFFVLISFYCFLGSYSLLNIAVICDIIIFNQKWQVKG